ncbi:MAG: amidohydrolase family protein [Rhodospirillaceae bacterium]|nr:amidohydrolase family protein [Rhodospirillaceae bacterium]
MRSFDRARQTPVNFSVPAGACDCHTHVYLDDQAYPMDPARKYTPPPATNEELLALQKFLNFDRVVIVQPSNYGADNRATLDGVKALGQRRARAVVGIDEKTAAAQIDAYHAAGARGVRVNLALAENVDPAAVAKHLRATAEQLKERGWHIQIVAHINVIAALKDALSSLPLPVVIDHFGYPKIDGGHRQPGFDVLVDLVRSGACHVKISGAYRCSTQAPDFPNMKLMAQALIQANPDRVVWGTDWPHPDGHVQGAKPTDVTPNLVVDDGALLNQLPVWAPDAAVRHKILVANPARLYDF